MKGRCAVDYRKEFLVEPGSKIKLKDIDPGYTGESVSEKKAQVDIEKYRAKLTAQQYLLYSEKRHSLLIVLQALDAAGKDGTVNHVMSAMNPQGTTVTGFKQPTPLEMDHDFLWRVHPHAPGKGSVAIFNRSHYEDVRWCGCTSWRRKKFGLRATNSSTTLRSYCCEKAIRTSSSSI